MNIRTKNQIKQSAIVAMGVLLMVPVTVFGQSSQATDRYLLTVQKACDAILQHALDTYGTEQSGMILSLLDSRNGKPLNRVPEGAHGVRWSDRTGVGGSNANLQQDLYRTLYELSRMTGQDRYGKAADRALADFLRITQSPETGLLAWGEHLYWNCFEERLGDLDPNKTHEPKRLWATFDRCYELDPQRVLAYCNGLWEHQIGDQKTGNFSRHAKYHKHGSRINADFEKEASYFIHDWSRAYAYTKDVTYDRAVSVLAQRYMNILNDRNLVPIDSSGLPGRVDRSVPLWLVSMAIECADAATRMPEKTAELLTRNAQRHDAGFLALDHAPADPDKGFMFFVYVDSGKPYPDAKKKTEGYSSAWGLGYGVHSTAMFVPLLYARQQQLGDQTHAQAYRKLILDAAGLYLTSRPSDETDVWAGEYGVVIFTELAAYRLTGESQYLAAAEEIGDLAIKQLWSNGKRVLPNGSSKTVYYDVTTYPDTTMLALLALHEAVNGREPTVPISNIIR